MQLEFILLAALFNYLRKLLRDNNQHPNWQKIFLVGFVVSLVMLLLDFTNRNIQDITVWFAYAAIAVMVYLVFTRPEFKPVKSRLYIFLPLVIVDVVKDITMLISEEFYSEYKNYFEVATLFAVVWLVTMLIINNKQRKALEKEREKRVENERMNAQLEAQVQERTAELTMQKKDLEQAILDLKATQTQLIQSEKMASLGELTAGIAHEIQNPLNFVNNFSEVSTELIEELRAERAKGGERNEAEEEDILISLQQNLEKIVHHGKRADAIVKGMLQHSRSSSGQKEPTDINALCDEYLRLAYHGLRAKDKSFNATMHADFDENVGDVDVIPQDIGRVILNLITNAFYAASQRKRAEAESLAGKHDPTVWVTTRRTADKVVISVRDNGAGIPQRILDKIFQPFFTTKPTGQGTGLGLSLSYDIVKAHGGELKVETKENVGSTFFIQLPA